MKNAGNINASVNMRIFIFMCTFMLLNTGANADSLKTEDVKRDSGKWHMDTECPFEVAFYSEAKRDKRFKVTASNGKFLRSTGEAYSSNSVTKSQCNNGNKGSESLYVVSPNGDFYIADVCKDTRALPLDGVNYKIPGDSMCPSRGRGKDLRVVHSLILGEYTDINTRTVNGPVAGAGIIFVDNGKVKWINNCSGHYQPTLELFYQTLTLLEDKGLVSKSKTKKTCTETLQRYGDIVPDKNCTIVGFDETCDNTGWPFSH